MVNVLRLLGCCFLSMLFVLELFAWLVGFGINLPLFIICTIGLIVLLVYTTWDILTIKDDRDYLTIDVKNLKGEVKDLKYKNRVLQIEASQYESMYKEACAKKEELNRVIQELEQDIQMLQEELNRLEGNNG